MKPRNFFLFVLIAALGVGLAAYFSTREQRRIDKLSGLRRGEPAPALPLSASPLANPVAEPLARRLPDFLQRLIRCHVSDAELSAFKRELLAADPAVTLPAILAFLADGRDAATGRAFALGKGGELNAPTLRVLLMDVLGQIARRTGSDAAATLARQTLAAKDSADEWAVALRNLAWTEPRSTAYLASKAREMLSYPQWRADPSAGMIEAFDVIVFTKDASFATDLAEAQNDPNAQLRYAASVALDRLAEHSALDVMSYLNTHPTLLGDHPMLRADYYAKADLTQPAQKSALEIYLGRPDVADAEKTKLLSALATPASFVAESLLTTPPPLPDEAARAQAGVAVTREWLAADRFPAQRGDILQLQRQLAGE